MLALKEGTMAKTYWARRDFLKALGAAGLGLSLPSLWGCNSSRKTISSEKPNIVFILIDDLGWADVGCYGSRYYETPHIDQLAREGMKFTDGYAACAVCSPTRASILTGRYPARLGLTDWIRARFQGGKIPPDKKNPTEYVALPGKKLLCPPNPLWMELDEITLAEVLKKAGYVTAHIGKWHLGADDWYPDKQGFDYNIGGCDFGQPPTYFDPYCNQKQGCIPTLAPRQKGEYLTDRLAEEAVKFIRRHKDQPFFLYLAHYAVHTPIEGRPDLVAKYEQKEPTHQKNPKYAAMVEAVDQAVGRVMKVLEETGLTDKTIVFFTSDNGGLIPITSNKPLRSGKGYPYEGGIREPVIIRWPGKIPAGQECSIPISSIDYFPTICEAVGVELPSDRVIDGVSLLPLLTRGEPLKKRALFWHFPHYRGKDVVPYSIVRAGEWKLIKRYEGPTFELFNLKEDLSETTDLAATYPEKVKELDALLSRWLKEVGAKLPRPNPALKSSAEL